MITPERKALNNRFKIVFDLLIERGVIIKNDRSGRGIGDLAKVVLKKRSYGHIITAYLNKDDKRCISYDQAKRFCDAYYVNEEFLLKGKGKPFGPIDSPSLPLGDTDVKTNVTLYSTEAFASDQLDTSPQILEQQEYYRIPGLLGGNYVAFPVKGNSMEPLIKNGDIVVCEFIESLKDIREREIYAIASDGKVWIKFIQQMPNLKDALNRLNLISANYLEHAPFTHEANTSTRIYKVVSCISNFN